MPLSVWFYLHFFYWQADFEVMILEQVLENLRVCIALETDLELLAKMMYVVVPPVDACQEKK